MKIKNPNFPVDVSFNRHRDAVLALVATLSENKPDITFDEIRAELQLSDIELPDGHIMQICIDANLMPGNKSTVAPSAPAAPVQTASAGAVSENGFVNKINFLDFIA